MKPLKNEHDIQAKIDAFLDGKLSEKEQEEFWALLLEYPEYNHYLEVNAGLRRMAEERKAASSPKDNMAQEPSVHYMAHYKNWIIATAAIFLMVIGFNLLQLAGPEPEGFQPIAGIDLAELESLDAFRDPGETPDDLENIFDEGLEAAVLGDIDRAVLVFEDLLEEFPDDPRVAEASFNLGVLLYNEEEYSQARRFFDYTLAIGHQRQQLMEKAWWFKANAELSLEEWEAARESLLYTYGMNGVYRRESFRRLRALDLFLGYVDFSDTDPADIDP